ncbi:MAG TPA: hypothetical protein VGN00_20620 [Puia sp.]|jgi:hypothetical protein
MQLASYNIAFDFLADEGRLKVHLQADVELHHSQPYYIVRNFRTTGREVSSGLPEVRLRRNKGVWVHTDSGKVSDLGTAIGEAIDAYEQSQKS